jgi:predicted DNA binding CopG/RHH family protein
MNIVMTLDKAKDTYIQIRIRDDLKEDIQITAKARGLTMSALIHSLLTQAVRQEKEQYPEAFEVKPKKRLAPVVARIEPGPDIIARKDIQRTITPDIEKEIERRITPRKSQRVPVLKQKAK